jgi:hypothetical protein
LIEVAGRLSIAESGGRMKGVVTGHKARLLQAGADEQRCKARLLSLLFLSFLLFFSLFAEVGSDTHKVTYTYLLLADRSPSQGQVENCVGAFLLRLGEKARNLGYQERGRVPMQTQAE